MEAAGDGELTLWSRPRLW